MTISESVHRRTPDITTHDGRGLAIRQIAYLRKVAAGPVETMITRQHYDAAGRLLEQSDPRLFRVAPNLITVYRLSGEPLKVDSVDAGWRLSLVGLAGEALQRWDQRGSHWRTTYDALLRPIAIEENGEPNVETFTYADASADPALNLRGQLTEQLDRSGTLSFDSYGLLGQPLRETRTLAEGKPNRSNRSYSPLGSLLNQTDAGDHQQQLRYDIAGQLKQVELWIKGSQNWQPILKYAQYNAAGQITEQRAGNDVLSTWIYDPADGRLCTQRAQKNAEPALQDFEYFYDRVGNITRIEDHAFTPIFFANQLIDGHRDFTYDSLYRLTSATGYDDAPPSDIPGRPLPNDPNNRLNYTQRYEYDPGGNLTELRHVRAGASHTREMRIDPTSNRGMRWKEGDPVPDFPELFDRHGNLQHLQPGKTLQWNSLDQLASVTQVKRDDGPDDQEFYRYSQGVRVYKRHETHTSSLTHFQEVIYLPGLEIRTRDSGGELHVITLPGGHGSVRCLHWVSGKAAKTAAVQLRYSLDDHLGSCALELDQNAQVISEEGYYPFGATAWYARGSEVDVDYKTIRYSGKEMDDSGLYYYGARYYAPWLQRWVSADPAGDVDGLNLYAMVGNNPIRFIDNGGTHKTATDNLKEDIQDFTNVLSTLGATLKSLNYQLGNSFNGQDIGKRLAKNTLFNIVKGGVKMSVSEGTKLLLGPAGAVVGPALSLAAGKAVDKLGTINEFSTPILADASMLDPQTIHAEATVRLFSVQKVKNLITSYDPESKQGKKNLDEAANSFVMGQAGVPMAGSLLAISSSISDSFTAQKGLTETRLDELHSRLTQIIGFLEQDRNEVAEAFSHLGINEFYSETIKGHFDLARDLTTSDVGTRESHTIKLEKIQQKITTRIAQANRNIELIGKHRALNNLRAAS